MQRARGGRQSPSAVGATESEEGRAPLRESGLCSWPQSMHGPRTRGGEGPGARGGSCGRHRSSISPRRAKGTAHADDVSGLSVVSGDRGGSGGERGGVITSWHHAIATEVKI